MQISCYKSVDKLQRNCVQFTLLDERSLEQASWQYHLTLSYYKVVPPIWIWSLPNKNATSLKRQSCKQCICIMSASIFIEGYDTNKLKMWNKTCEYHVFTAGDLKVGGHNNYRIYTNLPITKYRLYLLRTTLDLKYSALNYGDQAAQVKFTEFVTSVF